MIFSQTIDIILTGITLQLTFPQYFRRIFFFVARPLVVRNLLAQKQVWSSFRWFKIGRTNMLKNGQSFDCCMTYDWHYFWFEMVFFAATWLKSTSKRFKSKNMPTMKKYINIQIYSCHAEEKSSLHDNFMIQSFLCMHLRP